MNAWWTQPLRAVTLEFPASDVASIDVAGIVDETHRGGVNTLCVFATGYYPGGTAFYQSKIAPLYPGLGQRDLLAESIEAARHNGQRVIAYIASIWGSAALFYAHPDWAQRKANGFVTSWDDAYSSVAMCPNSPYRAYLSSVVREISDNYDLDGFYFDEPSFQSWCNCSYCQEKFYAEVHQPLPTEERWDDPVFQRFLQWRFQQISQWRKELRDLVKREERCVFFQGAFPLASLPAGPIKLSGLELPHGYRERFGVSWHVPMAHGDDMAHSAAIGDVVHFELYRRSVREPLWWYGVSLRYGQAIARDKPILVLNMMAHSPFDLYGMAEAELRLSMAEILANSGAPLFARYYPDRVDQEAWDRVYAHLQQAKTLEPYLTGRESIKYAAILFSRSALERFDYAPGKPAHLDELKGFAKALLQEHILFDVITEADLPHALANYRVVVLPNASCLSADAKQALRQFLAAGGGIVASYETGLYDEAGRRSPEDDFSELFGVAYDGGPPVFHGFDVYMQMRSEHQLPTDIPAGKRIPTGGVQVGITPAGAKPVTELLGAAAVHYGPLGEESGQPVIVTHQATGKGPAAFFAPPIGARYLEFGLEDHRKLIASAVRWAAGGDPPVRLENAPQTLAVTAFRQPQYNRMLIHLVNSVRDELLTPISEVAEAQAVRLHIDVDTAPAKVLALDEQPELSWSTANGTLIVDMPSLRYHTLIVVEHG